MRGLIILISYFFNRLVNLLLWVLLISVIIGAIYLSYRVKVNITKQAIIESNQNK